MREGPGLGDPELSQPGQPGSQSQWSMGEGGSVYEPTCCSLLDTVPHPLPTTCPPSTLTPQTETTA